MALTDPFSNTAPTGITPSRASAFDNTSSTGRTISRGDAFDNTTSTGRTISRGNAFDNTKPSIQGTGLESFTARAQATANIAPAAVISGAVLDFVTLADGDLVLLASQTAAAENGLYLVNGAGSPAIRATDHRFDFAVRVGPSGNVNKNKAYSYKAVANYVAGTSAVTFTPLVAEGRTV